MAIDDSLLDPGHIFRGSQQHIPLEAGAFARRCHKADRQQYLNSTI